LQFSITNFRHPLSFWEDANIDTGEGKNSKSGTGWLYCPFDRGHDRINFKEVTRYFYEDKSSPIVRGANFYDGTPRLLFHKRVFDELSKQNITGWTFNQVHVRYLDGTITEDFGELWVTGFGGVAPGSIGHVPLFKCRGCGLRRCAPGFRFGEMDKNLDWDGSDIFLTWPLHTKIFCSERVQKIFSAMGNNVYFQS
jgi:hypothetical protein